MTKLVTDDPEADGMFLCAVNNSLVTAINKALEEHSKIVPDRLMQFFAERASEIHIMCWGNKGSDEPGVPDLYGDEAYLKYVEDLLAMPNGEAPVS